MNCYSCGKDLEADRFSSISESYNVATVDGERIYVCGVYRNYYAKPRMDCLRKALQRLWTEERWCPACGETNVRYTDGDSLCPSCQKHLVNGREIETLRQAMLDQVVEAASDILKLGYHYNWNRVRMEILHRSGTEYSDDRDLTIQLRKRFKTLLEQEFARGVEKGSQLLQGLASGLVSSRQFDDELVKARKKIEESRKPS